MPHPPELQNALRCGDLIPVTRLRYCSDDNTYTERIRMANAWACPMELRPAPPPPPPAIIRDLFFELFPPE
jgi:hypothetical protein